MPYHSALQYPQQTSSYIPQGDNAATSQEFQPRLDKNSTKRMAELYKKSPGSFNAQQMDDLKKHSIYHNLPFYSGDFNILSALGQLGKGFLSGFTTFDIGEPPTNEYESIIRSIGHLLGFAPGMAAGPLKMLGARGLASRAAALSGASVPMFGANWLTKKAKKVIKPALETAVKGRSGATKTAANFLFGPKAKHMAEGAFHLGAASAISSWQQGVDGMVHAAFGGAIAGGVFRGLGNVINTGDKAADTVAKTLAGSLFLGLPATMRGATTAEQVYEYILGAYFGGKEMPWYKGKAMKKMGTLEKEAQKNPELRVTRDPSLMKDWESFEPEVKEEILKQVKKTYGNPDERRGAAQLLLEKMNLLDKDTKEATPEGFEQLESVIGNQELVRLVTPHKSIHHGVSGGAEGADRVFAEIGAQYNVPFVHYSFKGHSLKPSVKGAAPLVGHVRVLSTSELAEADVKLSRANRVLQRPLDKQSEYVKNLFRRNWFQVKHSSGIYAIGKLMKGNTTVDGGTGWAVQMGIDSRKSHVYVWDMPSKRWHKFDYRARRFVVLDKAPKLRKRFAGIGSRAAEGAPGARKAIEDLYATTLGKKKPTKVKVAEAKSEKDIGVPSEESRKQLREIDAGIEVINEELMAINEALPEANRADTIHYNKRAKELDADLNELIERLERILDLKTNQHLDRDKIVETTPSEDGNDIGMIPTSQIEKKSVIFVKNHMKGAWDLKGYSEAMKYGLQARYAEAVQSIINTSEFAGIDKPVKTEEIITEIEKHFKDTEGIDISIKDDAKLGLRQWLTMKNFGRQLQYVRVDGPNVRLYNKGEIFTGAGNRKFVIEPKKVIEEVFEEDGGEGAAMAVLDIITRADKHGTLHDYTLSDLRRSMKKGEYDSYLSHIMDKMENKGYYPFSGKGDKDGLIFVKHHPFAEKDTPQYKFIKKWMENNFSTEEKEMYKEAEILFGALYPKAKGIKGRDFNKMYISNILYDLRMNGFHPDLAEVGHTKLSKEQNREWGRVLNNIFRHEGYIKNATAFNKRAQIWFTPGYRANPEFVADYLGEEAFTHKGFIDADNFRYIIAKDLDKITEDLKIGDANTLWGEHVDGMIIVRDDIIDAINSDAGMPASGQNKSFIVSPHAGYGALLGKYMMHSAGETATKAMQKKGLHMIMQESAVKQRGERNITDYDIDVTGENMTIRGNEDVLVYNLPIEDIRYNYSVKNDYNMLNPKKIPKQLLTAMSQNTYAAFGKEMVEDFYNETVHKRFVGDEKYNAMLDKYLDNPNDKQNLNTLLKNIENIGVDHLLKAINEGVTEFTDQAYLRLIKFNKEAVDRMVAEGEMTSEDARAYEESITDFSTATENMIQRTHSWAVKERAKGRDGSITPILLHKYVRPWRIQIMRNYIMDHIAKPKIGNSAVARMRGYDKWMQQKFPELNSDKLAQKKWGVNADELLFLDESFRDIRLKTHIGGYENTKLGELWELYKSKPKNWTHKKDVEEILRALTVRVPMDSTSGAQVLKFAGFTGRKGHGALMHSRAMKAEGGADLDGDESFIFFGGIKGTRGEGFKKEWKDAFEANRNEFIRNGKLEDHKEVKGMRELLTLQDSKNETGIDPKSRDNKIWQYHSGWRTMISERAVDGRNMLGVSVNLNQSLKATHSAILGMDNKQDRYIYQWYNRKTKKKEDIEVIRTAKTGKNQLGYARQLAASMSGFASDPLDEAGLKGYHHWYTTLHDAFFNVKLKHVKSGKEISMEKINPKKLAWVYREGMLRQVERMNSAMFGRNWTAGRAFTIHEIKTHTDAVNYSNTFGNENVRNTMIPKLAALANTIKFSDSAYKRVHKESLRNMYDEHAELLEKHADLTVLLGRSSMEVKRNPYVWNVVASGIWSDSRLKEVALNFPFFKRTVKGTMFGEDGGFLDKLSDNTKENIKKREEILGKLRDLSEDFLTNDITDMVTTRRIVGLYPKIDKNQIKLIHRHTDKMKKESYLAHKERYNERKRLSKEPLNPETQKFWEKLREGFYKEFNWDIGEAKGTITDELSSLKDQMQVDSEIKSFKKNMLKTEEEKKLYDMLMLGSLQRGNLEKIAALNKKFGKEIKGDLLKADLLHEMNMKFAKTNVSKLGLSSRSLNPRNVEEFLGDFSTVMMSSWKPKEAITSLDGEVKKAGEVKEESIFEAEIDPRIEGTEADEIFSGFKGLANADKTIVNKETAQVITELAENLKFFNNKMGKELNEITRGVLEKDLNAMDLQDFRDLNNYFKEMRRGTIFQRLFKEKVPDLRRRYWWQFPATVNREIMKYDIMFLKSKGQFLNDKGESDLGSIRRPTNMLEATQNIVHRMNDQAVQEGEISVATLKTKLGFLDAFDDGEVFRRVAVREMEHNSEVSRIMGNKDIPNEIKGVQSDEYRKRYKEELETSDYENKRDKKYIITNLKGKRIDVTGEEIVERVKNIYKDHFDNIYTIIEGKKGALDKYITGYYDKAKLEPIVNHQAFIKDVIKLYNKGEGIPLDYGLNGLRQIARSMMIELATDKDMRLKLMKFKITPVGRIKEGYWPHMFFDRTKALESLNRAVKFIRETPDSQMDLETKEIEVAKLLNKSKTLTGDWMTGTENWDVFDKAANAIKAKQNKPESIEWYNANQMTGSMHSRLSHIPGWSIDATAAETYTRNIMNTYYKQFSQMMTRDMIEKFKGRAKKKGWDKIKDFDDNTSLMGRWVNYLKLYVQDAMGNPSIIPDYMLNDPAMKLKGTPYAWWADNKVKARVNKIAKKLGIGRKNRLVVEKDLERIDYQTLRHWSNLEAKFELMSLLAHPKSAVNNIFGGSLHTIQSTGLEYLKKARSANFLRTINPEWKSLRDVDDFVIRHGVQPEFILHEWGLSKELQGANTKAFLKEITKKLTKSGEVDDATFRELAKKHRVGDPIMNKAAKFMSVPERTLRRDAFMAHYIKAWERFGGAITNPDHPFLIELAKKGVKATQFLYSAPFRPAFARTALGKVMSRFMLWSWNAARFRNDVNREAKIRGFRRGTAEYERFKRTMQTDLFVVGLASVFAYSMFDSALPAPWNWYKDTAEWIFGDEKERDRAFFGQWPTAVAPLQMITPPIFRLPVSSLRAYIDDDYSKLADYYVYTMFPFGRMIRDVSPFAKGNLIENPMRLLEKTTGFPLGGLQKLAKSVKEGKPYHPRFQSVE